MVQMAITVDENIKDDIERLYNRLGMNVSTAVNMFFEQCLFEQGFPFQQKARKHIPLKERLKNYTGSYQVEEWDTGEPVGRELL